MKERPITFSAAEVRTTLAGQKSQFRRPVVASTRDGRRVIGDGWRFVSSRETAVGAEDYARGVWSWQSIAPSPFQILVESCPFGMPGDKLWARETWGFDSTISADCHARMMLEHDTYYLRYRATDGAEAASTWRPSTQMSRWSSRILLEVTDVRVERLQDIRREDVIAEGCGIDSMPLLYVPRSPAEGFGRTAKQAFAALWVQQAHGKRAPWSTSPWCWAVSFKRVSP